MPGKREQLLRYLEGDDNAGFVPAAFFLHFGPEYRTGSAAVARHREFFDFTGMDVAKIQFEVDFPRIQEPGAKAYNHVSALSHDCFRPQLEVVRGVIDALKAEALVVLTLYSPLMVLDHMLGQSRVIEDLDREPDPVFHALEIVTDTLLEFVRECARLGLDGFYHSTQGGEAHRFKREETFLKWVKPTDHRLMNEIAERFEFNILHICDYHAEFGGYRDLNAFLDYPGQVVNVSTRIDGVERTPADLSQLFGRPFMGGLDRLGPLSAGAEADARAAARTVLAEAPTRFILGADCTVPAATPWSNLRAAVEESHRGRV